MVIFAKIVTYTLNAYMDAQIAEEVLTYMQSNGSAFATKNTVSQQRAKQLVSKTKNLTSSDAMSYMIGIAYTLYYLNGLADMLYASLFWHLIISKQKSYFRDIYIASISRFQQHLTTAYRYNELIHKPGISYWYWPKVLSDPWRWAPSFAHERCRYTGPLNKKILRQASLDVQSQNIQNNYQIAQAVRSKSMLRDPKVIELRHISTKVMNPSRFLSHAATTQESAAKWDKLFSWMIVYQQKYALCC